MTFSASFWPNSSPMRNIVSTAPSPEMCRRVDISVKSRARSMLPTKPDVAPDIRIRPPPLASARLRNTSMWRDSSMTCAISTLRGSRKSGVVFATQRAGTSPATNSTSLKNVHSRHSASSMASGSGSIVCHGTSVAELHCRCSASSYRNVAFCEPDLGLRAHAVRADAVRIGAFAGAARSTAHVRADLGHVAVAAELNFGRASGRASRARRAFPTRPCAASSSCRDRIPAA